MRILMLGASGQVGHELRTALAPLGEVVAATRNGELADGAPAIAADLSDSSSLAAALERTNADVVVNAAAYTAVDKAESEREHAFRINAEAVGEMADWCAARGRKLIHYSTDYVFPGDGTRPYREDDPTGPLGVYGESKLAGERSIAATGCDHLIFRTAWVYAEHGHNFLRTMLRLGAEREELRVVDDQIGSPTPAALIARTSARALESGVDEKHGRTSLRGIYHLTSAGRTSWAGFARAIFERAMELGLLAHPVRVQPIAASEYPTPARRPAYSCLDIEKLQRDLQIRLPDWEQGLIDVLDRLALQATSGS